VTFCSSEEGRSRKESKEKLFLKEKINMKGYKVEIYTCNDGMLSAKTPTWLA